MFAQNIDCGHTLELPLRGGSNKYPQSMFWNKSKKNMYNPRAAKLCYIKVGYEWVYFSWTCFTDASLKFHGPMLNLLFYSLNATKVNKSI